MNKLTYKGGDTNPILVKSSSSFPIEKGDLVFRDPVDGYVKSATARDNHGTVALNQSAFAAYFVGVALQKNSLQAGEKSFRLVETETEVRVATTGRFEFDCPSTSWTPGAAVAIYCTTAGFTDAKKVMASDTGSSLTEERTIGRAVPGVAGLANAMTRVTVEIKSRLMNPDVQTVGTYSGVSGQA